MRRIAIQARGFLSRPAQLEDRVLRPTGENVSLLRVTIPR